MVKGLDTVCLNNGQPVSEAKVLLGVVKCFEEFKEFKGSV